MVAVMSPVVVMLLMEDSVASLGNDVILMSVIFDREIFWKV